LSDSEFSMKNNKATVNSGKNTTLRKFISMGTYFCGLGKFKYFAGTQFHGSQLC